MAAPDAEGWYGFLRYTYPKILAQYLGPSPAQHYGKPNGSTVRGTRVRRRILNERNGLLAEVTRNQHRSDAKKSRPDSRVCYETADQK